MMPQMGEIFERVTSAKLKSNFGGPAGGSALAGKRFRVKMFKFLIDGREETKCLRKAGRKIRKERNNISHRTRE